MRDITDIMNNYKECARHLWNTSFRTSNPTPSNIQSAFQFDEINERLFDELVLTRIGKTGFRKKSNEEAWPFLEIKLSAEECPALINRPSKDNGKYWDEPINRLNKDDVELNFISYFDWDEFNYIDYRYYKTKINSFQGHPHLIGREALIETLYGRVYLK